MNKKKLTPQNEASQQHEFDYTTNLESLSTAAQRARVLSYLRSGNALTTLYARHNLNCMHPAARVMELRNQGHNIVTNRRQDTDTAGRVHSVAEYVLHTGEVE